MLKKIARRTSFLRSLSTNHWRHLLRNLSEKEINWVLFWLGLAALSALFLSGYDYWILRSPAPAEGGAYTEGLMGEPRYLNPAISSASEVDRDITTLVFSGLVKHDKSGRIVPDLAASYEIKDGGKTYEFTLRENLTWPDKKPFTADDVVFTINLIKDPKYQSPLRNNWQGVRVEKIDDRRLTMKLPVQYEPFLENATVGVLPQHLWSGVQPQNFLLTQLNLKPVGLGQYTLTKITKNASGLIRSMEFSPNSRYYEKANISRLILRFYETQENIVNAYKRREIDGFSLSSVLEKDLLATARDVEFYNIKLPRYFAIFFNQSKSDKLTELAVRQALSQAVDRDFIVKEILKNEAEPQRGPFPFGLLEIGEPKINPEYDPEKAGAALGKAGWKIGSDGFREKKLKNAKSATRLEFVLTTTDWPELTQVASALKSDWEKIGVKVNLDVVPVNAIQNQTIRPRQYEALLFGEVLGLNPDPFSFWHSTQRKDPGLNLALYSNKKADGLLETSRQASDPEDRVKKYQSLQEIIMQDAPAVFLYSPNYIYAVSGKINGLDLKAVNTPSQRFENINSWYIATKRIKSDK
ncbi:MAG: peptide ABC transporter substrate-binding protein [Candidatus Sungbacteria bacterium]|uniref:Peptide ABC transporter substrate-binding protein n=1 Tax=Candidatus Sungiibacteriota bacterium TaxID=2750080 RepID=A0A931YD85_9BACT|nr:peptide ABC transporter substrate-binding protein [Candidatus Sungbacteria bacterium]